jgi:hypothetical protein
MVQHYIRWHNTIQTLPYLQSQNPGIHDGISVSMVRQDGSPGAVPVESTRAVDGGEAQAAADDEGVPLWARMERREGVTYRLHSRGRQRGALADVQVSEPILVVTAAHSAVLCSVPAHALALDAAICCQGVHGPVGDVLAVVQPQGTQVGAPVCKSNHTLIWTFRNGQS